MDTATTESFGLLFREALPRHYDLEIDARERHGVWEWIARSRERTRELRRFVVFSSTPLDRLPSGTLGFRLSWWAAGEYGRRFVTVPVAAIDSRHIEVPGEELVRDDDSARAMREYVLAAAHRADELHRSDLTRSYPAPPERQEPLPQPRRRPRSILETTVLAALSDRPQMTLAELSEALVQRGLVRKVGVAREVRYEPADSPHTRGSAGR